MRNRKYPKHRPFNHYDGYNELDNENEKLPAITSFKNFDYKGYDVKKMRKADSLLTKAWRGIVKASTSKEVKAIASLAVAAEIIFGNTRDTTEQKSVLKDISSGRVDFGTLEDMKGAVTGIMSSIKKK